MQVKLPVEFFPLENALQGGDFRKRMPFVLVWTGENAEYEDFRKRWRHELDNQSPTENENVSFSHS